MFNWLIATLVVVSINLPQTRLSSNRFYQSIFTNLESREQAVELNQKIYTLPGIIVSRCDIVSKKFFCVFDSNKIQSNDIVEFIHTQHFQLSTTCFQEGEQGIDKVIDLLKTCNYEK